MRIYSVLPPLRAGHSTFALPLNSRSAVERIWHTYDSQGQILDLAFRLKSFYPLNVFLFCSKAAWLSPLSSRERSPLPRRIKEKMGGKCCPLTVAHVSSILSLASE